MTFHSTLRRQDAGFIISIEYILIATLLTICFFVTFGSHVRNAVWTQLLTMEAAVFALNESNSTTQNPVTQTVDFGTEDGYGGFTPNGAVTPGLLGNDPVWENSESLVAADDGIKGTINTVVIGTEPATLTSPTYTAADNVNVTFAHSLVDTLFTSSVEILYQVNGGGFNTVPIDWFTVGGYNDTDHWSGTGIYSDQLGTASSMFTSENLTTGDEIQFRFDYDTTGNLLPTQWLLYNFEIDNVYP